MTTVFAVGANASTSSVPAVSSGSLPRIRVRPSTEQAHRTLPRISVARDIVSPLYPSTRPSVRDGHDTSVIVHRMLAKCDLPDRCRWGSVTLTLFYLASIPAWSTVAISILGVLCGVVGFVSCLPPHTFTKLMWLNLFIALNGAMVAVLWWFAVDHFIARSHQTTDGGSADDLYVGAFILVGSGIHFRAVAPAAEVVVKCGCWATLQDEITGRIWNHIQPSPVNQEVSMANRTTRDSNSDREHARSCRLHSFEIDVGSLNEPESSARADPSPSPSPLSSPATQYHRIHE